MGRIRKKRWIVKKKLGKSLGIQCTKFIDSHIAFMSSLLSWVSTPIY